MGGEAALSKKCFLNALLVYDDSCEEIATLLQKESLKHFKHATFEHFYENEETHLDENRHAVLLLSLENIKKVVTRACELGFSIGIIPTAKQKYLSSVFDLPTDRDKAIELALHENLIEVDILRCNGEIVLFSARLGDVPVMGMSAVASTNKSFFEKLRTFFGYAGAVLKLRRNKVVVKTAKEQTIKTAVLGAYAIEYDNKTVASRIIKNLLSGQDGKVNLVLLAPESIVSYLGFLFRSVFKKDLSGLKGAGLIKSDALSIKSEPKMPLFIDGEQKTYETLELKTQKKALKINVGDGFKQRHQTEEEQKDTLKVENLPLSEDVDDMLKPLPFFKRASDRQFASVFSGLRDDAKTSYFFIVMMFLSCSIATLGIFLSSGPVVIGAMILAPLMSPIVSASMGVLRGDSYLIRTSFLTIFKGILLVLATSAFFAYIMPYREITNELNGRLHPNLLDLAVAVFSGVAAAYAKHNVKVLGSAAGVAIAVALVPPLSVAGIGIGWGEATIFVNAFLLFLTNLFGIMLFSSFTFLILGFAPIRIKKEMYAVILSLFLVSLPLYFSFETMIRESDIKRTLINQDINLGDKNITVENVTVFERGGENIIRIYAIGQYDLDHEDFSEVKTHLLDTIGKDYIYEIVFVKRL